MQLRSWMSLGALVVGLAAASCNNRPAHQTTGVDYHVKEALIDKARQKGQKADPTSLDNALNGHYSVYGGQTGPYFFFVPNAQGGEDTVSLSQGSINSSSLMSR